MSHYVIRRDSDGKFYQRGGRWVKSVYEAKMFTSIVAAAEGETAVPVRIVIDEPSREVDERGTPVELTKREQERAFWERNFERVVASGSGAERAALEADWATKEWSARWGSK